MKLDIPSPTKIPFYKKLSTPLLVIAIIGAGAIAAWLFVSTAPSSKRARPPVSSPMVIAVPVSKEDVNLSVSALGTVKAAQETIVRTRVAGQVEELGLNFEPGGIVKKGELLLQLDDDDYQNALALKESTLAEAKAGYQLEMGQQRVARSELEQLEKLMPDTTTKTALALRKPQLAQAKANLEAAEADVNQAILNLERTTIKSPYNALVLTRSVSLGSQASVSDTVATLVGIDEYRIEAAVPLDRLQSLGMHAFNEAKVVVHSSTGNMREGTVLHAIASLDDTTRMGRVLVSIMDPLGLQNNKPPLLIGDHVRVDLQAGQLQNVVKLPRSALRGADTVWVAIPKEDGQYSLDLRKVNVAWRDTQFAIIDKGLEQNDLVITSPLGAPIQGMPVRLSTQRKTNSANSDAKTKPANAE